MRFLEFNGVVYILLMSLPIKLFFITGASAQFFGFFEVADMSVAARRRGTFSSCELDDVLLGFGEKKDLVKFDDSLVLPMDLVLRFLLKGFRMLPGVANLKKWPDGVAGSWRMFSRGSSILDCVLNSPAGVRYDRKCPVGLSHRLSVSLRAVFAFDQRGERILGAVNVVLGSSSAVFFVFGLNGGVPG